MGNAVYPEQAVLLACPFRRAGEETARCLAQDCMAWAWVANYSARGYCSATGEPPTNRLQDGRLPPNRTARDTLLSPTARTVAPPSALPVSPRKPDVFDEIFAQSAKQVEHNAQPAVEPDCF